MKAYKIIKLLVAASAVVAALAGCGGNDDNGGGKPDTYTLTIEATEGGTVSPPVGKHTYDAEISVTVKASAKSGYKFDCWTGASSSNDETITVVMDRNRTLKANFQPNSVEPPDSITPPDTTTPPNTTYAITFNANGGTVTPETAATGTNGKLASLPTPARTGYTFDGWYTATTGGTEVTTNTVFGSNTTIYARWNAVTGGGDMDVEMVYVSGGTFTMGCTSEQGSDCDSDESPTHSVTLSNYYIGKYEVTQGLWRAVMGSNPSYFTGNDNLPVERVSWNNVQTFIGTLNSMTGMNYRLPTEAEWEFAARGGNSSNGYKYSGSNTIGDVAWYSSNSSSGTQPVGTKSSNELGIYDMSGNVWEWVNDRYGSYSSSSVSNPTGPSSGSYRGYRGGSWSIDAGYCRVSNRSYSNPEHSYYGLGFRLARSP